MPAAGSADIVSVSAPEGTASIELAPAEGDIARAFIHCSPRALTLSDKWSWKLSRSLAEAGYRELLARDNRRSTLSGALSGRGWKSTAAVSPLPGSKCVMATTHDLPLDENLIDERGRSLDLLNTEHMVGVRVALDDRDAWAFYSDEGETARVVTDSPRRLGMLVVTDPDDLPLVADHLVRFLVTARKRWVVFSPDLAAHIAHLHPARASLLELHEPIDYEHSVKPVSKETRGSVVDLFSEYYDEGRLSAMMRLRRFVRDKTLSVHATDGGFVIVRDEGDSGLVYDIYVTPSRQGEGIGDELMRCALSEISKRSKRAYLRTSYPRARRLYEKFGFSESSYRLVIRLDEMLISKTPSR
ncbi:TPA: GNAT family N-acetyltransferase [Thermoplasmata archaeon]|nr:GNAT family N-acetyltransferase [Thermoplasmata archaeon]